MENKILLQANATLDNRVMEEAYGRIVSRLLRRRYSQARIEAIINNYLFDPNNSEYYHEFISLQSYRKYCKETAKLEMQKLTKY
jgi:hypothetical protein